MTLYKLELIADTENRFSRNYSCVPQGYYAIDNIHFFVLIEPTQKTMYTYFTSKVLPLLENVSKTIYY